MRSAIFLRSRKWHSRMARHISNTQRTISVGEIDGMQKQRQLRDDACAGDHSIWRFRTSWTTLIREIHAAEPVAAQPRHLHRLLALLDPFLCLAALAIEVDNLPVNNITIMDTPP